MADDKAERYERCCECDEETGKAGKGEDSIYIELPCTEIGPLCERCYDAIEEHIENEGSGGSRVGHSIHQHDEPSEPATPPPDRCWLGEERIEEFAAKVMRITRTPGAYGLYADAQKAVAVVIRTAAAEAVRGERDGCIDDLKRNGEYQAVHVIRARDGQARSGEKGRGGRWGFRI